MLKENHHSEDVLAWFSVWTTRNEHVAEKVALFVEMLGSAVVIHESGEDFMIFIPLSARTGEIFERVFTAFGSGENGL